MTWETFCRPRRLVAQWLLAVASPLVLQAGFFQGVTSGLLPLPETPPAEFTCLPEWFLEDMVDVLIAVSRNYPPVSKEQRGRRQGRSCAVAEGPGHRPTQLLPMVRRLGARCLARSRLAAAVRARALSATLSARNLPCPPRTSLSAWGTQGLPLTLARPHALI